MVIDKTFDESMSVFKFAKNTLKQKVFQNLTSGAFPVFLRGGDSIATDPSVLGCYEQPLISFITHLNKQGLSDFLIDIGANVGLISCQCGNLFSEVHMFEPNPIILKVLEANSMLSIESKYTIHPYALSDVKRTAELTIPKNNWGGAYINDHRNSYSESIILKKDNYTEMREDNYFKLQIEVEDAAKKFNELFSDLTIKNLTKGIIKIDVEGYEDAILKALIKTIPPNFELLIISECWNDGARPNIVLEEFKHRSEIGKFSPFKDWWSSWKLLKIIQLILRGSYSFSARFGDEAGNLGDDLIWVKSERKT
jgi:FkbM family methyltransferase